MYITTNGHMYTCTYAHMGIPIYVVTLFYCFLPLSPLSPLYPNGDIGPLNRLSEPCRVSVDLHAHMLTSPYPLMPSIVFFCRGAKWEPLIPFTCTVYP